MIHVGVIVKMGDRTHAAWSAIEDRLDQEPDRWFTRDELVEIGFLGSDLEPRTVQLLVEFMARKAVLRKDNHRRYAPKKYRKWENVSVEVRPWEGDLAEQEDLEKTNGAER